MKTQWIARQGDVLFRKIDSIPPGTHKERATGHILEGEATGHIHRIAELDRAEVLEVGEGLFLSVGEAGVSIVHDEHKTINLPSGNYEVTRQREYAPDAIRNVAD
jgi:hypothetical protein